MFLSNWKSQSSIIGSVNLQPTAGKRGSYTLHPASKGSLLKLKISPYNVDDGNSETEDESCGPSSSPIDEEFYEVEDVIDRKLSKDAHCYEYKVRFKGYAQRMICGYPRLSLTELFTLILSPSMEGRENIPLTRKTSWRVTKEQSGV